MTTWVHFCHYVDCCCKLKKKNLENLKTTTNYKAPLKCIP